MPKDGIGLNKSKAQKTFYKITNENIFSKFLSTAILLKKTLESKLQFEHRVATPERTKGIIHDTTLK